MLCYAGLHRPVVLSGEEEGNQHGGTEMTPQWGDNKSLYVMLLPQTDKRGNSLKYVTATS